MLDQLLVPQNHLPVTAIEHSSVIPVTVNCRVTAQRSKTYSLDSAELNIDVSFGFLSFFFFFPVQDLLAH